MGCLNVKATLVNSMLTFTATPICSVPKWEEQESCYGNGFWIDLYPWVNEDGWKNND